MAEATLFGVNFLPDGRPEKTQLCSITNATGERLIEVCATLPVNDYAAFLLHDGDTGRNFWYEPQPACKKMKRRTKTNTGRG